MVSQWKVINENYKSLDGYKKVAWPPMSEERIVREFTPQPQPFEPPTAQYQPPRESAAAPQQQYRAPSYDHFQQQQHQPHQHVPQTATQPPHQQQHQQSFDNYQQQPVRQNHQYQQSAPQQPQTKWGQPVQQQQEPHYQYQQQQQQLPPQQQYSPNYQPQSQQSYQADSQANHPQYNFYSQDQVDYQRQQQQQQQRQQSLPQDYRGGSPGIITLRKETPLNQKPVPVYTSQPAAVNFRGGSNMRGDMKWPPQEYKEAAAKENEERRKLALGPVCRPRKVNRDYTSFFAKNALSGFYPTYKVPPGTQHMFY